MSRNFKKRIVSFIFSYADSYGNFIFDVFLKYIDISVILAIYLPIWIVGFIVALIGKVVFADVTINFCRNRSYCRIF